MAVADTAPVRAPQANPQLLMIPLQWDGFPGFQNGNASVLICKFVAR